MEEASEKLNFFPENPNYMIQNDQLFADKLCTTMEDNYAKKEQSINRI